MCLITEHARLRKAHQELQWELEAKDKRIAILEARCDLHPATFRDRPSSRDLITSVDWDKMKLALGLPEGSLYLGVADTGSMDGMMDYGHDIILAPLGSESPYRREELQVGDVAAYQPPGGTKLYLHRIWAIKEDEEGRKYTFWGDNNPKPDAYIVRDRHIRYLLVGIIY